jgi:HEAT repeat protein
MMPIPRLRWASTAVLLLIVGVLAGCGNSGKRRPSEPIPELVKKLKDADPAVRAKAADDLRLIAPDGKEALPQLFEMLDDEDSRCRNWAAEALGVYGEDAYPLLIKGIKHDSGRVRAMSWMAIGGLPLETKQAHSDEYATILEEGLKDKESSVRQWAAYSFNRFNTNSPKALPVAIAALKPGEDKQVLGYILDGLEKFRDDAKPAIPALRELAKLPDPQLRSLAGGLLVMLGEPDPHPNEKRGGEPAGPRQPPGKNR